MALENLREKIFENCRTYFQEAQSQKTFTPGQTYIPASGKVLDESDLIALVDASLDMWLTTGRFGATFEKDISGYFGRTSKGLLVNSGSSANLLAVSTLGSPLLKDFGLSPLEKGDEVITVAAGFPTTVNPIVQNGWTPVFVDVDKMTLNATTELVSQALTKKTKAVVLAHTLGNPYRADQLAQWCKDNNLYLVEDCCDALGAQIGSSPVGSFGHLATCSFYPAHHITMGEGGVVIAENGRLRKVAESIRDWGRDCWCDPGKDNTCGKRFSHKFDHLPDGYDHKYVYSQIGYNLKVTDMQAAIGVSQLKKANQFIATRRSNWEKIYKGVKDSPVLRKAFSPVEPTEGTTPSWFGFPIFCNAGYKRETITRELENKKIGTRLLFAGNITKQPAYKNVEYRIHGSLATTDLVMNQVFWVGVHPGINDSMIQYMLETMEQTVKQTH